MKIFSTLTLATLLATQTKAQESSELLTLSCLFFPGLGFYDFRNLQKQSGSYEILNQETKQTYFFNLCGYTDKGTCEAKSGRVFAQKVDILKRCTQLTNDDSKSLNTTLQSLADGTEYVRMQFNGGEACPVQSGQNYSFTLNLMCDKTITEELQVQSINSSAPCAPVVTASHKNACPVFSVTSSTRFLVENPFIFGLILLAFGMIVGFQGRKFFPLTIGFIGIAVGFLTTLLLFLVLEMLSSIKSKNAASTGFQTGLSFLVSAIVGVFLGFVLKRMLHIGAAIIGAVGGFFIGVAIYNIFFFFSKSFFLLRAISILCAIAMAVLSFKIFDHIVIFSTSVFGSYTFVRGVSLFLGNFPNEIDVINKLIAGENQTFKPEFWFYIVTFIALSAGGIVFQLRQKNREVLASYMKL